MENSQKTSRWTNDWSGNTVCAECKFQPTYELTNDNSRYCPCCGSLMRTQMTAKDFQKHIINELKSYRDTMRDMTGLDDYEKLQKQFGIDLITIFIRKFNAIDLED